MRSLLCTIRSLIPSLLNALLAICVLTGASWAQAVEIRPDQPKLRLDSELRYWPGLRPNPGPAIKAYREGLFSTEPSTVSHGFGHAREMWFAVEVKNDSFDDGRAGDPFVLVYDAPVVVGYRLFLVRQDGLTENLVDYSVYRPFAPTDYAVNRLRSPEFQLAPGEQVTVLAHLQLGMVSISSLHLSRPDTLQKDSLNWASTMTAFYAFSFSCLLLGVGFQIAMRHLIGSLYVAVLLILLIGLANSDMLMFRFLFPDQPLVHRSSTYGVFLALSGTLCLLVSERIRPPHQPRPMNSKALVWMAVLSVLGFLCTFIVETELYIYASFVFCAIALIFNIFVPEEVWQREDNPHVGVKYLSFGTFLCAGAMMVWTVLGWNSELIGFRAVVKLAYVVMMLLIMTFLTGNLIVLRRRHLAAVDARVDALEREAERSKQLLETERAYFRARETAAARQRQLATASHDIRQPLMSLRTTFDALALDLDQTARDRLKDAFTYLENLSKSYVDGSEPDTDESDEDEAPFQAEEYALSVPLNTVHHMFNGEAVSKGLRLRVVESTLTTTAPPMVLMRILTNLVSNGLKYTTQGRVLLGVRRSGPEIWICDTGGGMNAEEIERFKQAYKKGTSSDGHGLGLSVCFELAAANNMALEVRSKPGEGTIFTLSLAEHNPPD